MDWGSELLFAQCSKVLLLWATLTFLPSIIHSSCARTKWTQPANIETAGGGHRLKRNEMKRGSTRSVRKQGVRVGAHKLL